MVSRSKKIMKAQKRKAADSPDLVSVNEVTLCKRKTDDNEEKIVDASTDGKDDSTDEIEADHLLPTRNSLIRQLLVALRAKRFVIVEGPIGCGKTFLCSHASKLMRLPLKVMQMGDQIDSKSLFGSYQCTEVAGQFLWKSSCFHQWLNEPCLILLEDIDLASADVINAVVQLASERFTTLSSGEEFIFNENVRICATISGKGRKSSVLDGVPVRIQLRSLSDEELRRLITKASPRIAHLAKTIVSIFRRVEATPPTANSRQLTSADLLRGCARLNNLSDLSSNIAIFTELIDTWCLADPPERALVLCKKVAAPLSITENQVLFHLSLRQPTFSHDDRFCNVGRCRLPTLPSLQCVQCHCLGHTRDVLQLMERLAVCVKNREPVLLVGETGVGKTSIVQSLASSLNVTLKVVNLSPSSDADELISGYKPATIAHILQPFTIFYHDVFTSNFDVVKNQEFLNHLEGCLSHGRYRDYLSVVIATAEKALSMKTMKKDVRWATVMVRARRIREGLDRNAAPFILSRGAVLEAAQEGHWLLIDEINLAPAESLDAIVHAVSRGMHPNFRLFACMNPATDAGKRRLPASVRTRFVEYYVSETVDAHQLALMVYAYLPSLKAAAVSKLVDFYLHCKQLYPSKYSLRTLCRALCFASENTFGNEDRSLYEGVCMAFLNNLSMEEKEKMRVKINQTFHVQTAVPIPSPSGKGDHISVEGYWIERGVNLPQQDPNYIVTKTVQVNLAEIARITASGRFPILLEGETSAGKTSIVCYLARITGNKIVRINNHEHTDIQEYMGSYVGDAGGRLVFREGALVKAVKDGSWVILDELNLAPTDIIEALNRLLDDNRELFVPELNVVLRAHPRFRLFATQNPAGTYGGRKRLSRALMSRFVVLKFDHLPLDELSSMVCARCGVHKSASAKIINVLSKLRLKRSVGGVFSAKDGLMTLRDVFRWARRLATDITSYDWLQVLANHGYFLLAGRCRNQKDVDSVVETLENELKRKIEPLKLFALNSPYMPTDVDTEGIVMTLGMRRMLVLTEQAWLRNEAVLLVGETGCGKTSLAQVMGRRNLMTINCHERTETADFLGRLRPREKGGFAWSDGIVISAMKAGTPLLIDEISLAEDSVLERLNPLFEEDRTLLLSDSGVEFHPVKAEEGFQIIATMNPGGDYGKKELSKALRNRFTEVWSNCDYEGSELLAIFDARVIGKLKNHTAGVSASSHHIISWIEEFFRKYAHVFRCAPSVRDVVACAEIYAACIDNGMTYTSAIYEAISAVFLDALGSSSVRMTVDIEAIRCDAKKLLWHLCNQEMAPTPEPLFIQENKDCVLVGKLPLVYGSTEPSKPKGFSLHAPTCVSNFYRIARGLLITKPILLEGAPGCGKSSTVMALAQLTGHPITRLNLSDQTDLSDLFGSDVPVVTADGSISFRWEDGPVLRAIKKGEWVLLDEMNLASQSVLEGLNACFDHRRVLYIAELNRSFEIPPHSNCRFFACQNPRTQGGNRRALPKSFVNRFTSIYMEDLTREDILTILKELPISAQIGDSKLDAMVSITMHLASERSFCGGPYCFNLRDILRWVSLFQKTGDVASCFEILFVRRMRSEGDRQKLRELYANMFNEPCSSVPVVISADESEVRVGNVRLSRSTRCSSVHKSTNRFLPTQTLLIHQYAVCVDMQWLCLIVGPRNCGKRSALENLAQMCGAQLHSIVLNSETDAQELIGSYEQVVDDSAILNAKERLHDILSSKVEQSFLKKIIAAVDIIELEIETELALTEMKENVRVVTECREVLAHAARSAMRFEWRDSPFVKAYLEGHWLLIEDVNLCSAAVLDRLNCCLESDGQLVVSERQSSFEPLKPHPNFRVFLSMDPRSGEISRAMRNRSVELYVDTYQHWFTHPVDVAAVTSSTSEHVPLKVAETLCSLSAEKQLHFAALLSELSVEDACRGIELQYCDTIADSACDIKLLPFVREVGSDSYDLWLLSEWKDCSAPDSLCGLLLALLSSTTSMLKLNLLQQVFGESAHLIELCLQKVAEIEDCSHHPIDARFHGGILERSSEKFIERFVVSSVSSWFKAALRTIPVAQGSAEKLCRTLSRNELANLDVNFLTLQFIGSAVDAVAESISASEVDEDQIFPYCLRLFLFVIAARKPLNPLSSYALLYIAWQQVHQLALSHGSPQLKIVVQLISKEWPLESYDRFINSYLSLYENYRLADAFHCEDDCQRLISLASPSMPKTDMKGNKTSHRWDAGGYDTDIQRESPISRSLKLVAVSRKLYKFFSTGLFDVEEQIFESQRPLLAVIWRKDEYRRFAQIATMCSSEYIEDQRVLSLCSNSAFSTVLLSFYEGIEFDPMMRGLSVSQLDRCELKTFEKNLWRFAPNSSLLSQSISRDLALVYSGLKGWCEDMAEGKGWKHAVKAAIQIMESALPPLGTLDPLIFNKEKANYESMMFAAVNEPLTVLAEWRNRISRQVPECDARSSHPVIAAMWHTRYELEKKRKEKAKSLEFYRQSSNQYFALCSEMRAFFEVASAVIPILDGVMEDPDMLRMDMSSSQLQRILAQLKTFAVSASTFKQKVLTKFPSFLDISMTFLHGTSVLVCALFEACGVVQTAKCRQDLSLTSSFPMNFKLKMTDDGLESPEILSWVLGDAAPMPLQLKAAVVRRRIQLCADPHCDLQWTIKQWRKWYERNIAKAVEKDFMYQEKSEEEKDELDVEGFFSEDVQKQEILSDNDLISLLEAVESHVVKAGARDLSYSVALLWIRHLLYGASYFDQDLYAATVGTDLDLLHNLISRIETDSDNMVDVHRAVSLQQLQRAARILKLLTDRTKVIRERWPEQVSLKLILEAIERFNCASLSMTHIKMAALFENILEQCEQWEKVADRANSLRNELIDARELLIDWKRMEVRSWSKLLNRVENDGKLGAMLVSFPLFDVLFKEETTDSAISLCAMAAEWIASGTLLDYSSRIKSVRILAKWAKLLGKQSLGNNLGSISAHFEQYVTVVEQSLLETRKLAENSLEDYVKIMKYNDLNQWNINVSSQKAHAHLYKIVRKFKEAASVQASTCFDTLVDMKTFEVASPTLPDATFDGRLRRAVQLSKDILTYARNLSDTRTVIELIDQIKSCDEMIRTQVNYQGEDEEKEKHQGYARNARQRAVAMVIKGAQAIGLNARKAIALNQEELTRSCLIDIVEGQAVDGPVRNCAGGRNACVRKAVTPNDQLGVATRNHLCGVIDYGMAWILRCHITLATWEGGHEKLTAKVKALRRVILNAEAGWFVDHERLAAKWNCIKMQTAELLRLTNAMQSRIAHVPEPDNLIEESLVFEHPLTRLHTHSPELQSLQKNVAEASSICQRMHKTAEEMYDEASEEVYDMSTVTSSADKLASDAATLDLAIQKLENWFDYECAKIIAILKDVRSELKIEIIEVTKTNVVIDSALIFIQTIFKSITDNPNSASSEYKLMERLELLLSVMSSANTEKAIAWATQVVSNAKVGIVPDSLEEVVHVLEILSSLMNGWNHYMMNALQDCASMYYAILSMSIQLFEKGYVNLIPKVDKLDSGQGEAGEVSKGGGLGEGTTKGDVKDVTDEMEESGQIEGLQDEEHEPFADDAGQNEKLIDVDEDFAEDLRDIDRNEDTGDAESEKESENEPEPEDTMGDIDEEDDQQLDPKLWDEDEKDTFNNAMDQDNAAAGNKTEEMAAKENETTTADERIASEEKDGEAMENHENVDEREREEDKESSHGVEVENSTDNEENFQQQDEITEDDMGIEEALECDFSNNEEEVENGPSDEDDLEVCVDDTEMSNESSKKETESDINKMDEANATKHGIGGQRIEHSEEEENGGMSEEEFEDEQKKEIKGQSKSDDRGENVEGAEARKKEKTYEGKDEEEAGDESQAAKERRELAHDDEAVEEKELSKGEQNELGQNLENALDAARQMVGAGSFEEAKQSMNSEVEWKINERKKLPQGVNEAADSPLQHDDNASDQREAYIHLAPQQMFDLVEEMTKGLTLNLEKHTSEQELIRTEKSSGKDPFQVGEQWQAMCQTVDILSAELAENLRLILEPQRASKMQGDYHSGKRLNMRRLIPYIASEYRKDRIWMRRTKKAQRDYQVLIAVDDSASMNENGILEVTCASACVVEDALRRSDAGAVSVCSFGSDVKIINSFDDNTMHGPELLQKLSFDQTATDLVLLLDRAKHMLSNAKTATSEQLLIIISDGRGTLAQGADKVKAALSALQDVTVLFVILDSGQKSICDLSVASFQKANVILTPYLAVFPFPFYTIIKSITQLPPTLTESIRQWFEMTVRTSSA